MTPVGDKKIVKTKQIASHFAQRISSSRLAWVIRQRFRVFALHESLNEQTEGIPIDGYQY